MLDIRYEGLEKTDDREDTVSGLSWIIWRRLELRDTRTGIIIPDWFLTACCSPEYADESSIVREHGLSKFLVMQNFNETSLDHFVHNKFQSLEFDDWDDFYKLMSQSFIEE